MKVMNLITVIALLFLLSCNSPQEDAFRDKQANEAAQRAKIENTCEECWNKKNMEKFREISTENFVRNVNDITVANNEKEMEAAFNVFFTGFPDLHISLHDITVKDTHAFAHWIATGTNTGVFGEVPATGKKVNFNGFTILQYDDAGKLAREDVYFNELTLLQQLGYTLSPPVLK